MNNHVAIIRETYGIAKLSHMSTIYASLKAAKRRAVQTLAESVSGSEKTIDADFETYSRRFDVLMKDMNECKQ